MCVRVCALFFPLFIFFFEYNFIADNLNSNHLKKICIYTYRLFINLLNNLIFLNREPQISELFMRNRINYNERCFSFENIYNVSLSKIFGKKIYFFFLNFFIFDYQN